MFQLITDKIEWNNVLKKMVEVDFYHTHEYHTVDSNKEDKHVLLTYNEGTEIIAFPLLIRKIPGTTYFDATSVSGYVGPITKNISDGFDNSTFRKEFQNFLIENRIISVFTRLNPFIRNQEICLSNIGEIAVMGNIVTINLNKPLEEQRQVYQKRLKTYINKSRRSCSARIENTPQGLEEFMSLYEETMLRLQAAPRFFFPKAYFQGLLGSKTFQTEIWLARANGNGRVIAGAIFVKKNRLVHYHLSGAKAEFLHLNPIKLIIDERRIQATKEKLSVLNLGGGVGGQKDSLFRFKNSFSNDIKPFKVWKYIVEDDIYDDLVAKKYEDSSDSLSDDCKGYFPLYRCNRQMSISPHAVIVPLVK